MVLIYKFLIGGKPTMGKTIANLIQVNELTANDVFVVGTAAGDRKVPYNVLVQNTSHNAIFRGKNLGTVTAANIDAFITQHGIATGVFNDIYVGDYFTASYAGANTVFRIAGINFYKNTGDTQLTANHVVIVPDGNLTTAAMNSTNTTGKSANEANTSEKSGFLGSDMWNIVLPDVNEKLAAIFGGHLLTHREILSNSMDENAIPSGNPSWKGASNGWEWVDCKAVLMSEVEVYGAPVCGSSLYDVGIANCILPLFVLEKRYLTNRSWFWLRGVASSANFCYCTSYGVSVCNNASNVLGVRPRFLLG